MIERKISTNGIEIYIKETDRVGETILLLHCSSWNSEQWNSCLSELSKEYHIIAPDLRGHGRSNCPEGDYRLSDFANDIYGILDELQIDKLHIVGSSMGAEIALQFASNYPDKVLSLSCEGGFQNFYGENGEVILCADQVEEDCKIRVEGIQKRPIESYDTVDEMLENYSSWIYENQLEDWYENCEAILRNRFQVDKTGRLSVTFKPHYLAQYCEDFYMTDFSNMYKKLKCPVQFMPDMREASDDSVQKSIEHFRTFINGCSTYVTYIERAKHALTPICNAEGYTQAVKEFLNNIKA